MEHSTSDQPTGPTDEPAMLNLDALGGVKAVREAMCVAQVDIGRSGRSMAEAGRGMTLIAKIIDACDVHRPLGPDGKHGTGRHTPTCGCVDKTYPEHGPKEEGIMGNEDWERWPQPRDRTRWKAEVRDVWVPWLRGCSHGTMVLANDSAYWTRLGMADNGVTFWVSGLNVVSDMVLCKLHDEFVVVDEVIHV